MDLGSCVVAEWSSLLRLNLLEIDASGSHHQAVTYLINEKNQQSSDCPTMLGILCSSDHSPHKVVFKIIEVFFSILARHLVKVQNLKIQSKQMSHTLRLENIYTRFSIQAEDGSYSTLARKAPFLGHL